MCLSGGYRERYLSLFIWVVDIIQFLEVVRLIPPLLFWLSHEDHFQHLQVTPFLGSWHVPSIFKANNNGSTFSPLLKSSHLILSMKLSYRLWYTKILIYLCASTCIKYLNPNHIGLSYHQLWLRSLFIFLQLFIFREVFCKRQSNDTSPLLNIIQWFPLPWAICKPLAQQRGSTFNVDFTIIRILQTSPTSPKTSAWKVSAITHQANTHSYFKCQFNITSSKQFSLTTEM